ncbi:hypothetical protein ACOMHN_061285 [Nucella lapillus]
MASNQRGLEKRQRNRDKSTTDPSPKRVRLQNPNGTENAENSLSQFVSDHAPLEVSVAKFAECRARELKAMTEAVEKVGGNKLSFQRLPKHMRRRAMSHNIRRIPRRLRQRAQIELEKREKKGASKRPSRRFRRRPSNLLSEYQRRQRRNMWLETHIWHAKRFKMTTAWGYRLPVHPSDKSLRACYRASTHHCLLQDISYECCIQVRGPGSDILDMLSHLTSKDTGLTFGAKVSDSGRRWGKVTMYTCDSYPQGAMAPITFLWQPPRQQQSNGGAREGGQEEEVRTLWMWTHSASYVDVWNQLTKACILHSGASGDARGTSESSDLPVSQPGGGTGSTTTKSESPAHGGTRIQIGRLHLHSLKDQLVKFRLSGPASNLILSEVLKPAVVRSEKTYGAGSEGCEEVGSVPWWVKYYGGEGKEEEFSAQVSSWEGVIKCQSPGELPPQAVVALTVRDPRILLPSVRTKAVADKADSAAQVMTWDLLPPQTSMSPLMDEAVREEVTQTKLTEQEMNRRRSELLVSGSILQLGDEESRIPVLLLQRPGSQPSFNTETTAGRCGVGSGWDLVAPKTWAMAFWTALVYRGARVGGLREARSLAVRSFQLHFPHDFPDSASCHELQQESRSLSVDEYVRHPPAKRVNYQRLGVPAPFHSPWAQLVAEWQERVQDILNPVGESGGEHKLHSTMKEADIGSESAPVTEKKLGDGEVGERSTSDAGDSERECSGYPEPYVLRCRLLLRALQEVIANTKSQPGGGRGQKTGSTRLSTIMGQPSKKALLEKHLSSLVPFAVSCQSRGVPVEHAMICLPTTSDLEQLAKDPKFPGPTETLHSYSKTERRVKTVKKKKKEKSCVGVSPAGPKEDTNKVTKGGDRECKENTDKVTKEGGGEKAAGSKASKGSLNPRQQREKEEMMKEPPRLVEAVTDRPIIGFLTNGDFDLGQGHGAGVGLCCLGGVLAVLRGSMLNKPLLVLVRNPTSRQYRFATLSLLS